MLAAVPCFMIGRSLNACTVTSALRVRTLYLAAASEIADRLHGKPVQAVDIDDERPNVPVFIMPQDAHIAIK
jgi:hypothetical protein